MGVYVKGMEMPKDGYRQVFIDSNGTVTWFNNGADGPNTMYKAKAFPVPPHGDLIDRDALKVAICSRLCTESEEYLSPEEATIVNEIFDALAIIPAEPEEET